MLRSGYCNDYCLLDRPSCSRVGRYQCFEAARYLHHYLLPEWGSNLAASSVWTGICLQTIPSISSKLIFFCGAGRVFRNCNANVPISWDDKQKRLTSPLRSINPNCFLFDVSGRCAFTIPLVSRSGKGVMNPTSHIRLAKIPLSTWNKYI